MRALPKRYAVAAMAGIAAVSLAACGGSSSSSSTASSGKPVSGGTLHIVAAAGPDHIDTVPAYYTADYQLERMYTRQLLSYPTDAGDEHVERRLDGGHHAGRRRRDRGADHRQRRDHQRRQDLHVPHQAGRGLGHRPPPPGHRRQDFLREFKAFFNPVSPVGNPVYYESTIAGLTAYCNAETAYFAKQVAPADGGEHRELPELEQHLRHLHAELVDDPVHADRARQRLPLHDGDAVHLGPPGGVRQLRAEQPAAGPAHAVRRAVPDQLLHPGQVDHVGPEPGLEAVDRHRCGTTTSRTSSWTRSGVTSAADPAGRPAGRHRGPDQRHADQPGVDSRPGGVARPSNFAIWPWSDHVPVHRVQPAQPERERRHEEAARPAGGRVRPGQDRPWSRPSAARRSLRSSTR